MKAMLEEIVKGLVDDPSSVRIDEVVEGEGVTFEVSVAENDLGKVIGKEGKIANALRVVMRSAEARNNRNAQVEIVS